MANNDLISRAAAIDALTDKNIEKNFDSVYDGELHKTKRAAIRIIANIPTIYAIPVEWLIDRANDPKRAPLYRRFAKMLYEEWQKEQGGRRDETD